MAEVGHDCVFLECHEVSSDTMVDDINDADPPVGT
ncbi:hypothetical protein LEMLEM_LOCUS4408 [Lemmus lemmus]